MSSLSVQEKQGTHEQLSLNKKTQLWIFQDVFELRLVTLVGLPLSLLCLLICIVTFYIVRSIQSTCNTIHWKATGKCTITNKQVWKLAEKFSSLNPDLDSPRKIKAFLVTAIAQLCILGIMWVFGCFPFNEKTLAMSYNFTILSSLQGVLMFIVHCWLSKQVREEYTKFLFCVCAPQKRKYTV